MLRKRRRREEEGKWTFSGGHFPALSFSKPVSLEGKEKSGELP